MNVEALKDTLSKSKPTLDNNVNSAAVNYTQCLETAVLRLVPEKTFKSHRKSPAAPWFSKELKTAQLKCRLQERTWRKEYCPEEKIKYKKNSFKI